MEPIEEQTETLTMDNVNSANVEANSNIIEAHIPDPLQPQDSQCNLSIIDQLQNMETAD